MALRLRLSVRRAEARRLRRLAFQSVTNPHAKAWLLTRALGLDWDADDLVRNAEFRETYSGPFVPPMMQAAE